MQDNEELKADVEELEALRELADELEESHIETEKQLQEELGGNFLTFYRMSLAAHHSGLLLVYVGQTSRTS